MTTARRKTGTTRPSEQADVLVFSGPPGQLRATVTLANTGDQRLAVRGLTVRRQRAPDLPGLVAGVVAPGTTAALPVTVALEPGTGPGDYAAEVEVAGVRRPAVLHVEPELAMRVSPRRVLAEPGRQDLTIVVVNEGNVDVPLASLTRARTCDGGDDPGPDVTLTLDRHRVAPAASSLTLTAHIEVPTGLDPTRRHRASVPVGLADLEVIVLARSTAPEATP